MKRVSIKEVLAASLCLFGNVFVRLALAEPSASDKSMAAQLFEEGRTLLEQGRVDAACPKLEESQHLDPGGGTLLNVALCHERQGRTATAWVEFVEARGIAKADNRVLRVTYAETHIAELEPTLSRVVVQVPGPSDVPDLEIKFDGSVVGRGAWGSAMPVDPGDHIVEAAAPGKIAWTQSVTVASAGDTRTVVVPALQATPAAIASSSPKALLAPAVTPTLDAPASGQPVDSSSHPGSRDLTTPAWIAVALGVAGAGASTYFGLHAISLKNDADRQCPGDECTAQGASTNHDAIEYADLATGAAVVGVAGLGVATALFVMSATHPASRAPARSSPLTLVGCDVSGGAGRGELTVRGRW